MSDEHTGLSHDLPEYVPNWPSRPKVTVFRAVNGRWYWGHACRDNCWISGPTIALNEIDPPLLGCSSQPEAFQAALKHVQGCP